MLDKLQVLIATTFPLLRKITGLLWSETPRITSLKEVSYIY